MGADRYECIFCSRAVGDAMRHLTVDTNTEPRVPNASSASIIKDNNLEALQILFSTEYFSAHAMCDL